VFFYIKGVRVIKMIALYGGEPLEGRVHRDSGERKVAFIVTSKMFHGAIVHYLQ